MSKRGVSPLIATVLLIGFIIALAVLAGLWGKNYIQERAEKEGKLAEKQLQCENVKIEIVSAAKETKTSDGVVQGIVRIVIKNQKDISIGKFTFRVIGQETEPLESYELLKNLEIKPYEIPFPEDIIKQVLEVDVIPWLRVARGNYVPCSNQHITAKVQSV